MPTTSNPRNHTYIIERLDGTTVAELKADKAERDPSTGYVSFFDGGELVASYVNVNFHRKVQA